jgi:hypothetical protein
LSEAADDGHCFLPAPNLLTEAAKIPDVDRELIGPCLDELAAAEGLISEAVAQGDQEVRCGSASVGGAEEVLRDLLPPPRWSPGCA